MFPPDVIKTVAIYRLPSSGDAAYALSSTVNGAMLPLDRKEHALEGGIYRNPFELYLDPATDIQASDKLVIDSTTYFVKQVFRATFGGLAHLRCSISTEE